MYIEERNPFFKIRSEGVHTTSGLELNKLAVINDETDDVLGIVSPNYELVTNEMVNDLFLDSMVNIEVKEVTDHMDAITRKWKRRFIFDGNGLNFEIIKGDFVGIALEIFNGYDARTAFGYELMGFRYVCSNVLVMGKQSLFKESYAHYVNNPEKLRVSYEMKFEMFKENVDIWKRWSEESFDEETFKEFVEGRSYLGEKAKVAMVDSYTRVLNSEGLDATKYGAFNVLTFLATHETKARNGSNLFSNAFKNINRMAADLYEYCIAA